MTDSETYASPYHTPVMVEEVLEWLDVEAGGNYVDGTAGGGGHSNAILEASEPDGRLLAIDRDPEAIEAVAERLSEVGDRLLLVRGNYSHAARLCRENDFGPVDGFLVDAGVSSHQLDATERGFSFDRPGPLDMRMGPAAMTLEDYLESVDHEQLAQDLGEYGEVSGAYRKARAILRAFEAGELETTTDLASVVASADRSGDRKIHPATLVFQGLRIAINQELKHLKRAVESVPEVVRSGGRAVFISFHSLEDRIVKHGFRDLARECVCPPKLPVCACDVEPKVKVLTRSPLQPSEAEVERNPRSRSAKLRAVEVL